jgi:hypothetical protein
MIADPTPSTTSSKAAEDLVSDLLDQRLIAEDAIKLLSGLIENRVVQVVTLRNNLELLVDDKPNVHRGRKPYAHQRIVWVPLLRLCNLFLLQRSGLHLAKFILSASTNLSYGTLMGTSWHRKSRYSKANQEEVRRLAEALVEGTPEFKLPNHKLVPLPPPLHKDPAVDLMLRMKDPVASVLEHLVKTDSERSVRWRAVAIAFAAVYVAPETPSTGWVEP